PIEDTFGCKFFLWKEERVRLLVGSSGASTTSVYSPGSSSTSIYSLGSLTHPRYSPGASTPQSYSMGTSKDAECSNCKHLLDKITVLEATWMLVEGDSPVEFNINVAMEDEVTYGNLCRDTVLVVDNHQKVQNKKRKRKPKALKNDKSDFQGLGVISINGKKIDLPYLACDASDEFEAKLSKMTEGMIKEAEFMGVLKGLEGKWSSTKKRRKFVKATIFGDAFPKNWRILLGLRPRVNPFSLYCCKFESPSGIQFDSCKEAAFYIKSLYDVNPLEQGDVMLTKNDSHVDNQHKVPMRKRTRKSTAVENSDEDYKGLGVTKVNGEMMDLNHLARAGDIIWERRIYVYAATIEKLLPVNWQILISLGPHAHQPSLHCWKFVRETNVGLTFEDSTLVRKLLTTVPDRFLHIVASIEQYSDLDNMSLDEAIGGLKTFEERLKCKKERQPDSQERLMFSQHDKHHEVFLNERNFEPPKTSPGEESLWYLDNGASNHMTGKHARTPFPQQAKYRSKTTLDLIYGDLYQFRHQHLQDQAFGVFKEFKTRAEKEHGTKIKTFRNIEEGNSHQMNSTKVSNDEKWIEAMQVEIDSINKNNIWKLTTLPQDHKAIGLKWVFKTKRDANGEILKHKARLVAKGYIQEHGIDFDEVFAPFARIETIRLILALAAYNKWETEDKEKVYRLRKALYGLRQAPRAWYTKLDKTLKLLNFKKCALEHAKEIESFKYQMQEQFEMSDLGLLVYYLGIEVTQKWGEISIKQTGYATKILKDTGMLDCNDAKIPMEPGLKLTKLSYSDSSYGVNTQEGKDTTGIVFYFGNSPITWSTKKQGTVALSSCKSEFIAATAIATQALWLKRLLSKITDSNEENITIHVDNKSAIALIKNPVFHGRSEHIDTKYHFIRECVEKEDLTVEHISGEQQRADILKKALPMIRFVTMRHILAEFRGIAKGLAEALWIRKPVSEIGFPPRGSTQIIPTGRQFDSCKDVAFFLKTQSEEEATMLREKGCQVGPESVARVPRSSTRASELNSLGTNDASHVPIQCLIQCNYCTDSFKSISVLESHLQRAHKPIIQSLYTETLSRKHSVPCGAVIVQEMNSIKQKSAAV
nr:ribonuclease H-like domain, reverse transcriptase, RNA-dependent DNA polymerase [Tanacetum cinerariifolium]